MTPWFDADCQAARRRAVRGQLKDDSVDVSRQDWTSKLRTMHSMYESKNDSYWRKEITASKGNMKKLWKALHGVLGEMKAAEMIEHTANDFATFFNDKVASVHVSTATTPLFEVQHKTTPLLSEWTAFTADKIDKLIGSAPNKTCQLDPIPTWLVKDVRGFLSPFITLPFCLLATSHLNSSRPLFVHCLRRVVLMPVI